MPRPNLRDAREATSEARMRQLQNAVHQLAADCEFHAGPSAVQIASYTRVPGVKRYLFHLLVFDESPQGRELIDAMMADVEAALKLLPGYDGISHRYNNP